MELRRVCGGVSAPVTVRKLHKPVIVTLATDASTRRPTDAMPDQLVTCAQGEASEQRVTCMSGGASRKNVTLAVRCNGTQAEAPVYCPALRSCVFFNRTSRVWSEEGCVAVSGWRADQPGPLVCECDHLTDFAVYQHVGYQLKVVVMRYRTDREFLRKSLGLIIALLCVHAVIFTLLLRSQFKRPVISEGYIRSVETTRMYKEGVAYVNRLAQDQRSAVVYDASLDHFFSPTKRCVPKTLSVVICGLPYEDWNRVVSGDRG
jgi:hypothetical protein